MAFLWVLTLLGAIVGGLVVAGTLATAKSSPQEASGFALALACVVIPYVFTRACEGIGAGNWQRSLIAAVESLGSRMQASAPAPASQQPSQPLARGSRTEQQCIASLEAAGAVIKPHNSGWEITIRGTKHYAYSVTDLNKWADRY